MIKFLYSIFHPTETYREEQTAKIQADALTKVQAREFNGQLWLAYNDKPLVAENMLNTPLTEAIQKAREAYIQYSKTNI